jgi:hypothetical protein
MGMGIANRREERRGEREKEKERMQGRTTRGQAQREGGRDGGTAVSPRRRVRHKQARATQIVCVAGCLPTLADKQANQKKPRLTRKNAHTSNERKQNPQHSQKPQIIVHSSTLSHPFPPSSIQIIVQFVTHPFIFSSNSSLIHSLLHPFIFSSISSRMH